MATRYWVGGTGSWTTTNTVNWSDTSGGAGGFSVPTSADDVIFDSASNATAYTVTMTGALVAKSLNISGPAAGNATAAGTGTLSLYGNLTVAATGVSYTRTGATSFLGGTATITPNGKTFSHSITVNGATANVQLGGALTATSITVTTGIFATNDYAMTGSIQFAGTAARIVNWGSSTVSATTGNVFSMANMTFNAGTSTLRMTNGLHGIQPTGGTPTFYNVVIEDGYGYGEQQGPFNCTNLTFQPDSTIQPIQAQVILSGTITVTGLLTIQGGVTTTGYTRWWFRGPGTISAASASVNDATFERVTFTGAAAPLSGTRLGDVGGNTGITFDAPKTVYLVGSGATSSLNSGDWATTSGGTTDIVNSPLAHDTAVIDNNSVASGGLLITPNSCQFVVGTLTTTARTLPLTFDPQLGGQVTCTKGLEITSSVTIGSTNPYISLDKPTAGIATLQFAPTSGGHPQIASANLGTWTLSSNCTSQGFSHWGGGLNLNNYTITTATFNTASSTTRTLAFGTGAITCTGPGTAFSAATTTGLTVSGSKTVNITYSGSTAVTVSSVGTPATFNYNFTAGTYTLTFLSGSSNYAGSVNFTGFSGTWAATGTAFITGNLTLSSTMTKALSPSIMSFAGAGTTQTINTNGVSWDTATRIDNPAGTVRLLSNINNVAGSAYDVTLANGTLDLNGFTFTVNDVNTETGTKNITFNGGTLKIKAATIGGFLNTVPTGFSTTAGTGTGYIEFASPTSNTFTTGGSTYNCTVKVSSTGGLTFSTSPSTTLRDIVNTVSPTTVSFSNTSTFTFLDGFSLSGTPGNLVTIDRASGASTYTLSKASGVVSVSYCSISNSVATGGASWQAPTTNGNVNAGGNTGWSFANTVTLAASVAAVAAASAALGKNTRLATITSVAVSAAAAIAKIARLTFGPYAVDEYVVDDYYVYAGSKSTATARLANNLSAAAQVVVSASASLVKSNPLAATSTSTSTATASLGVTKGFASSVQAVVSATGAIARTANMAAAVTCTSTAAASLNRVATLADLASTGSITNVLSAALSLGKPVAAIAVAVTSATGAIERTANLSASSACLSTATGAVSKTTPLAASAVALASSTAATSISKTVAGSVFNVVTATPLLTVGKGLAPLAGTGAVTNVLTATVSVSKHMAANAAVVSTGTANIILSKPIAGSAAAVATSSPLLLVLNALVSNAGQGAVVTVVAAGLAISKRMAVNATVVSTGTANVILSKPIAAVASATVTAIPNLLVGKNLNIISGQGATTNVMSAGLAIRKDFVGQLTCLTLIQGGLSINKSIATSAQAVVAADVNLTLDKGVESAVTAEVTSNGAVAVSKPLAATVLTLATINGRLVFSHINDIESLGVVTADIEAQQYYADAEVVAPAVEAGQQTVSADISASEMYASVTSSRLYADAVLLENDMVVDATADEIFVYKQAA